MIDSEGKRLLPIFFNYEEEGADYGYEAMQDFFLSWTLRCAKEEFKSIGIINEYGRRAVFILIHGENSNGVFCLNTEVPDNFRVIDVKTKRSGRLIDLIAVIDVEENSELKTYVLNIENKWYTSLKETQLQNNLNWIKKNYKEKEIISLFITCDDCRKNYDQEKLWCKETGYKFLAIGDIAGLAKMEKTKHELFDTYWFEWKDKKEAKLNAAEKS